VQVAFLQQFPPQADGGVVGVAQKGVLDDDASAAASLNPSFLLPAVTH
jgi:hypothetical protein